MKKLLVALVVLASAMTVVVSDADARRLGSGSSFGRRAPTYSRPVPTQAPSRLSDSNQASRQAAPQQPGVTPQPASRWRGILGGALLGLGLGGLLAHFGMGGAMAGLVSMLLVIGVVVLLLTLLMRLFRGKPGSAQRPAYAGAYEGGNDRVRTPEIGSRIEPQLQPTAFQDEAAGSGSGLPSGFDAPAFLRTAKTYFIRLQAAWDRADINDIREFTTPEMFGELRLQLQERGAAANHTDVVSLDAELLGVEAIGDEYVASIRFSGMIKEAENAAAEPFTEIWNLTKPLSGQGGWILAGIQQVS